MFPPPLGRALGALFAGQHHVEHIKDKFGTGGLKDPEWITVLGEEGGWCVLSGDLRIAKKRPSRQLFLQANLVGFFPLPAVMALPLNGIASRVLAVWPVMEATAKSMDRGCFEMGIKGARFRPIA
jgi:hypothetical protein